MAEHRRLLIAVHVEEAFKSLGGKHGSREAAIKKVAKDDGASYHHVKDISKDNDPDFRRAVAVEMDLRRRKIHGEG